MLQKLQDECYIIKWFLKPQTLNEGICWPKNCQLIQIGSFSTLHANKSIQYLHQSYYGHGYVRHKKKTTNISIKHPLICLQLYSSSQWMECDFETVRPSKYWHCCFEETCSNMFRLLSDFPQKENICFSHLTANFCEWSPIQSVFIRTTANRGPICLSWVWLQIK